MTRKTLSDEARGIGGINVYVEARIRKCIQLIKEEIETSDYQEDSDIIDIINKHFGENFN